MIRWVPISSRCAKLRNESEKDFLKGCNIVQEVSCHLFLHVICLDTDTQWIISVPKYIARPQHWFSWDQSWGTVVGVISYLDHSWGIQLNWCLQMNWRLKLEVKYTNSITFFGLQGSSSRPPIDVHFRTLRELISATCEHILRRWTAEVA